MSSDQPQHPGGKFFVPVTIPPQTLHAYLNAKIGQMGGYQSVPADLLIPSPPSSRCRELLEEGIKAASEETTDRMILAVLEWRNKAYACLRDNPAEPAADSVVWGHVRALLDGWKIFQSANTAGANIEASREMASIYLDARAALDKRGEPSSKLLLQDLVDELRDYHIPWSKKTFGEGRRTGGICRHIVSKLEEIRAQPLDMMEWIDIVILALDGAWRTGASPESVVGALLNKMSKIRQREYPMPASDDEPSMHVEQPEQPDPPSEEDAAFEHRNCELRLASAAARIAGLNRHIAGLEIDLSAAHSVINTWKPHPSITSLHDKICDVGYRYNELKKQQPPAEWQDDPVGPKNGECFWNWVDCEPIGEDDDGPILWRLRYEANCWYAKSEDSDWDVYHHDDELRFHEADITPPPPPEPVKRPRSKLFTMVNVLGGKIDGVEWADSGRVTMSSGREFLCIDHCLEHYEERGGWTIHYHDGDGEESDA